MLGLVVRALLVAAAAVVVSSAVIYISGTITRVKLEEKLQENGVKDAMIDAIDRCNNVVSIKDLESDKTLEIHGDDVSYELSEGDLIYV